MIIIIPALKYNFTYYNTFTMGICNNYHGYFFQCNHTAHTFLYTRQFVINPQRLP